MCDIEDRCRVRRSRKRVARTRLQSSRGGGARAPCAGAVAAIVPLSCGFVAAAAGVSDGAHVYFVHSYFAPVTGQTIAGCDYGEKFTAIVGKNNFNDLTKNDIILLKLFESIIFIHKLNVYI